MVDSYRIGDRRTPAFESAVHLAFGQIMLSEGDFRGAARCLRRARDEWREVGAPYETAQARLLLGLSYRRAGDEDSALSELEAALATFKRLGAKLAEERVKELLAGWRPAAPSSSATSSTRRSSWRRSAPRSGKGC